jgi:hypothetical protein
MNCEPDGEAYGHTIDEDGLDKGPILRSQIRPDVLPQRVIEEVVHHIRYRRDQVITIEVRGFSGLATSYVVQHGISRHTPNKFVAITVRVKTIPAGEQFDREVLTHVFGFHRVPQAAVKKT